MTPLGAVHAIACKDTVISVALGGRACAQPGLVEVFSHRYLLESGET